MHSPRTSYLSPVSDCVDEPQNTFPPGVCGPCRAATVGAAVSGTPAHYWDDKTVSLSKAAGEGQCGVRQIHSATRLTADGRNRCLAGLVTAALVVTGLVAISGAVILLKSSVWYGEDSNKHGHWKDVTLIYNFEKDVYGRDLAGHAVDCGEQTDGSYFRHAASATVQTRIVDGECFRASINQKFFFG